MLNLGSRPLFLHRAEQAELSGIMAQRIKAPKAALGVTFPSSDFGLKGEDHPLDPFTPGWRQGQIVLQFDQISKSAL